jgi:Gram-negative bacterial TonB protein C-terminal
MRLAICLGFSLCALACHAQAGETAAQTIKLTMEWNLSLDAQGNVVHLDALASRAADQVPQVRERLNLAIPNWKFSPGTVNGKGAATDTVLSVAVALLPQGGDAYRIRVEDARTGGRISKAVAPHYPFDAVHNHTMGMVVMHVSYDANGEVTSVAREPRAPKVSDSLVKATAAAMKQWKFQTERVDGHGVAGTTIAPACFSISDVGSRPPAMNCQWTPPGHTAISEGQSLALEPAARLLTEIAGHTL